MRKIAFKVFKYCFDEAQQTHRNYIRKQDEKFEAERQKVLKKAKEKNQDPELIKKLNKVANAASGKSSKLRGVYRLGLKKSNDTEKQISITESFKNAEIQNKIEKLKKKKQKALAKRKEASSKFVAKRKRAGRPKKNERIDDFLSTDEEDEPPAKKKIKIADKVLASAKQKKLANPKSYKQKDIEKRKN